MFKKLLLNELYAKYLKKKSLNKLSSIFDGNSSFYKICYRKSLKNGNFVVMNSYFVTRSLLGNIKINYWSSFRKVGPISKYKALMTTSSLYKKFQSIIVFKSIKCGYLCMIKGIFTRCKKKDIKTIFFKNKLFKLTFFPKLNHAVKFYKTKFFLHPKANLVTNIKFNCFNKYFIKRSYKFLKTKKLLNVPRKKILFIKLKNSKQKLFFFKKLSVNLRRSIPGTKVVNLKNLKLENVKQKIN